MSEGLDIYAYEDIIFKSLDSNMFCKKHFYSDFHTGKGIVAETYFNDKDKNIDVGILYLSSICIGDTAVELPSDAFFLNDCGYLYSEFKDYGRDNIKKAFNNYSKTFSYSVYDIGVIFYNKDNENQFIDSFVDAVNHFASSVSNTCDYIRRQDARFK